MPIQRHPRRYTHRQHLQGWELGIVAVAIALLGVLLSVPIAVAPDDLPVPIADGAALATTLQEDRRMAVAIVPTLTRELDREGQGAELYDLRAFGVAIRAYGKAEKSGDTYGVVRARQRIQENVARARASGDTDLLAVRAYQSEQFRRELVHYENTGTESDELVGLAGPFVDLTTRYGWMRRRVVSMDEALRATFWKRRWNELTGLGDGVFALTVDEQRAFYAYVMQHPPAQTVQAGGSPASIRRAENEWLLRKVEEVGRVDPTYPTLLSRGVLLYRLERFAASSDALRAYLSAAVDQPYALRARNYLAAASQREAEQ